MAELTFTILLGILVVPNVYSSIPTTDFFPFGRTNGDTQLPAGRGTFVEVPFTTENIFNFFRSPYNKLFVNNNGAISFSAGKVRIVDDVRYSDIFIKT